MVDAKKQFRPDYAVTPGWVLEERLEVYGISQTELAQRCGCTPQHISAILAGEASVGPEIARQFEKELGLGADIWLGIEQKYRLHKEREGKRRGRS